MDNKIAVKKDLSLEENDEASDIQLEALVDQLNNDFKNYLEVPLRVTLGEEIEGVVNKLSTAINMILIADELILTLGTDQSLYYIVEDKKFKALKRTNRKGLKSKADILIKTQDQALTRKLNLTFGLYRSIYNKWSVQERKIAAAFLAPNDYREVARMIGRDASTMWRKEKSLKMKEFKDSRELINLMVHE